MASKLDWTTFVCPACGAHLETTRASVAAVALVGLLLAATPVNLGLQALGANPVLAVLGDIVAWLSFLYVGLGNFSSLRVASTGERPFL